MDDRQKTKEQLITELQEARQRISELEESENVPSGATEETSSNLPGDQPSLFEKTPAILHSVDAQCRIVSVSDRWLEWLGYERDEVLGRPSTDFLVVESKQQAKEVNLPEYFRTGFAKDVPYQFVKKNGDIADTLLSADSVTDSEGRFVRSLACIRDITTEKKAQEALIRSEAHLAEAEQVGKIGNWEWDARTNDAYWSDGIYTIFGVTREEFTPDYEGHLKFIPPEDLEAYETAIQDCLLTKEPFEYEHRVVTPAGEIKTVWVRGYVKLDEHGNPTGMRGTTQDITARKIAEDGVKARERLLDRIYEILPVGVWIADKTGRLLRSNRAGRKIWGAEALVGPEEYGVFKARRLPSGEVLAPEDWALARTVNEGITVSDELLEIEAFDGEKRIILNYSAPVLDENGKAEVAIILNLDVTKRMRAEESLRRSEEKYRGLFENSPLGIISADSEGRILEVNPALLDILGSPSKEATKSINMFEFPALIESGISDAFRSCMRTGDAFMKEIPYVSNWGKQSYLHVVMRPIAGQDGAVCGCEAIVEDITKQRILEDQLRQSQKMEAIGTLAGGIAHDFNNLLQIISGHTELLETELAEQNMRFTEIDAVRQAVRQGSDLVRQILTFSTRVETKLQPINLNEDVKSAERLLYRTIPKMIRIQLRLEENLKPVLADATQIEQMLINLAINAKDAMPEGGTLTVETLNARLDEEYCLSRSELVPGQYVLLKVSDTGSGMTDDVRKHIFEPFYTTKGLADGTGLGLSTVFGIVKMHRGHISCESEIGKGTTFTICLPADEEQEQDWDSGREPSISIGGTEAILVVDDEPLIAELAKRILEKAGYSIITSESGIEALDIYEKQWSKISLVILDLIMPEMGGKQCLEELLKINPQVKALIASGFAVKDETKSFLASASKGMVSKPFNIGELLRSVRSVLDGT